jgi:transposase
MEIAIDLGKRKSYVVMAENGVTIKEGYVQTKKDELLGFFEGAENPKLIVEASSTVNRIANMFEGYDITVANPRKVRIIAESVSKTDKNDAHTLLDLYKKDYLPESWLPPKEVRDARDLCRNRDFLVKQRTAVKNRLRYQAYLLGIEFVSFSKKQIKELKQNHILGILVQQLESLNKMVYDSNKEISSAMEKNRCANLLYSIPGVGEYGALAIASEIGDVSRFSNESAIFMYTGLVPRVRQSGNRDFHGRITKGNVFMKTLLVECVQMHIRRCPRSFITQAYYRIRHRKGHNKAKIAAARRLLQVIYWMLKRNEMYRTNE